MKLVLQYADLKDSRIFGPEAWAEGNASAGWFGSFRPLQTLGEGELFLLGSKDGKEQIDDIK